MFNNHSTVGVILDHLSVSQLGVDFMLELNKTAKEENKNVCIFAKNLSPPSVELRCGVFGLNLLHNIDNGLIIATDLDGAEILINSQTTAEKAFYVWDLEWLHNPNKRNFLKNVDVYRNIKLLTRSESYADAIENYANVRPEVISISETINGLFKRSG